MDPQKDSHWITDASVAVFVLLALAAVIFLYYQNQQLKKILSQYQSLPSPTPVATLEASPTASPSATPSSKACTQEAKLCPNGSYVGRTGPNCEFAPCPTPY